jgi:hypothetical protein
MALPPGETRRRNRLAAFWGQAETRVAIVTAVALVVQAVLAKNVLEVDLDYGSQFSALWVFIVFLIGGQRDRRAEIAYIAAIIAVTAAVLFLYAV